LSLFFAIHMYLVTRKSSFWINHKNVCYQARSAGGRRSGHHGEVEADAEGAAHQGLERDRLRRRLLLKLFFCWDAFDCTGVNFMKILARIYGQNSIRSNLTF
jgi:hypothetical protein